MEAPSPQGSGMVKAAWLQGLRPNERPDQFDRIMQSWDSANKASELSGFSVCTSWHQACVLASRRCEPTRTNRHRGDPCRRCAF
jgi:hypothetical protein